jgi:hypothetical protein
LDHHWPLAQMLAAVRKSFGDFISKLPVERQLWFKAFGA